MTNSRPEDKFSLDGIYDRLKNPFIKRGSAALLATIALSGCANAERVEAEQAPQQAVEQPTTDTTSQPAANRGVVVEAPTATAPSGGEPAPIEQPGQTDPTEPSGESLLPEEFREESSESLDSEYADASPEEVAFAFAKAFAEVDGETSCELDDNPDCNPDDLLGSPGQIGFTPTEIINIPTTEPDTAHFELPMQEEEWGVWCIRLNKSSSGWKVTEYTTPPPPEKCD